VATDRATQVMGTQLSVRDAGIGSVELWDEEIDAPAAGLRVVVSIGSRKISTVTNDQGVVCLVLPPGERFSIEIEQLHKLGQVQAPVAPLLPADFDFWKASGNPTPRGQ